MKRKLSTKLKKILSIFTITIISLGITLIFYLIIGWPNKADSFYLEDLNSILGTIAQVLSGTLAISFSFSLIAIQISSERYSTSLINGYWLSDISSWVLLLISLVGIFVSIISSLVNNLHPTNLGVAGIVFLFTLSLLSIIVYFYWISRFFDTSYVILILFERNSKKLKSQHEKKFENEINSNTITITDILIKSIQNSEIVVFYFGLNSLAELFKLCFSEGKFSSHILFSSLISCTDYLKNQ